MSDPLHMEYNPNCGCADCKVSPMPDQKTCKECCALLDDQGLCAPGCGKFPQELIEARLKVAVAQNQACLTECILPLKARLLAEGLTVTYAWAEGGRELGVHCLKHGVRHYAEFDAGHTMSGEGV